MTVDQISVFVENKSGKLAEITKILYEANIDMRALSIADTTDFGILRLIVDRPDDALKALREAECVVSVTQVLTVRIGDKPGSLAKVLALLETRNISIEYLYAFITRKTDAAYVVFRMDDNESAEKLLLDNGYIIASPEDLYEV